VLSIWVGCKVLGRVDDLIWIGCKVLRRVDDLVKLQKYLFGYIIYIKEPKRYP